MSLNQASQGPQLEEQLRIARELQADRTPIRDRHSRIGLPRGGGRGSTHGGVGSPRGSYAGGSVSRGRAVTPGSTTYSHAPPGATGYRPDSARASTSLSAPAIRPANIKVAGCCGGIDSSIWNSNNAFSAPFRPPSASPQPTIQQRIELSNVSPTAFDAKPWISANDEDDLMEFDTSATTASGDEDLMDFDAPVVTYRPTAAPTISITLGATSSTLSATAPSTSRARANPFPGPLSLATSPYDADIDTPIQPPLIRLRDSRDSIENKESVSRNKENDPLLKKFGGLSSSKFASLPSLDACRN